MVQITPDKLAELRRRYTKGSRVKLIHMNDPYRPDLREGALGTVTMTLARYMLRGTVAPRWAWSMEKIFVL